jgi:hypothetical protein
LRQTKAAKPPRVESFIAPKTNKSPRMVASIDHHDGNFAYGGAATPAGLITGESLEVLAGE